MTLIPADHDEEQEITRVDILGVVDNTRQKLWKAILETDAQYGCGMDSLKVLPIRHFGVRIDFALLAAGNNLSQWGIDRVASIIADVIFDAKIHPLTEKFFD